MSAVTTRSVLADDLRLAPRWLMSAIVAVFLLAPALYGVRVWLDPQEAWLHPELLATSAYIWGLPDESIMARLAKAVDWKAFDPNVNRVRPLNDSAETIDAVARPYVTAVFGAHPSITPVAVFTAIVAPVFFFLTLRRIGLSPMAAAALTGMLLASTGFLSVLIAYIRPAKKITMFSFCICLYLAYRHEQSRSQRSFWALIGVLFLSFFADEMDLVKWPVLAVLCFPSLLWKTSWTKRLVFLSLPILFLVVTAWGLPAFYARFSVHGAWDALADTKKAAVLGYLADPFFWVSCVAHLARSVLTTVGVSTHVPITEGLALLALIGGTGAIVMLRIGAPSARFGAAAAAVSLVGAAFYTTLLDWYPFPNEISYLGSFTYYYHSSLVIPVVLWIGFVWLALLQRTEQALQAHRIVLFGGLILCGVAVVSSFATFHQVNRLVQYIHIYPFSEAAIYGEIRKHHDELLNSSPSSVVQLSFSKDRGQMAADYDATAQAIFGSRWTDSNFHILFEQFKKTPIMLDTNIERVVHAYYPRAVYQVRIQ